jgi:arginase
MIEPDNRPRPLAIVGAPSSIGIRPHDDGGIRRLDLAPRVLRDLHLVERLAAHDHGDVDPPPYHDFMRPAGRPRNEEGVAVYSRALAERIAAASANGAFVLVLGGDCSIILGNLLGLRHSQRGPIGLAYVDAHADFGTPEESRTGSAASMCLALAVGRGDTPLARLGGEEPLVHAANVVLIGRRDHAEPWYGHEALHASKILDLPHAAVREHGTAGASRAALDRLARAELAGFWIHFDADVLDPSVMPAVDSPVSGGLGIEELADLLTPLIHHPKALGLELTIYDPTLDPDRTCAARLVALLEQALIKNRGLKTA